ncbi:MULTISPECIES: LytTR family transcriptional regulator DNA-binding domain-containing protein [unclassified Spirosoma]|uniref:LytR/AlgR family response regulator transcription factor n=1 Tax=unclassified Spirosoma TaxID=2621999 RepID=UPI00095C3EB2|nr:MULTISPECIES: LytTR family transcriptional regulator DNA-binding domain-containing protein [unclassified Spirosoma]MBN8823379.1 LytTR family transcriptional regulator DNA-binding domain-containing protein [Spirosoma sp.]OJW72001.1 MAG: DNA-binding response regulator [Spirosoma sp. 48-14]
MTFPLKTILIDDEALAISRLRRLLDKHRDTFDIIGEASNGAEGLTLIEAEHPDIIFLDIEMPLLNGFEMLAKVTTVPMVVFATAFNQYAIRAFEENSVDYLLKPIEADRLTRTAQKIRNLVERNESNYPVSNPMTDSVMRLLAQMQPKKEIYSISVKTGEKIILIPLSDIAYFEAEDKYVFLATLDGQKYLTSYTLTTLNEKLPDTFVRISRSVMVNRHKIGEIHRHFDGKFVLAMNDRKGTKLTSGSTYGEAVRQLMEL